MKCFILLLFLTLLHPAHSQISAVAPGDAIKATKINSMIVEINKMYDIGDIRSSLLTESQFQSRNGSCWVLLNGQNVSGTEYAALTGRATLPQAAGRFLRNAGGAAGELATTQEEEFKQHTHIQDAHGHTIRIPNTSYSLNISSAVLSGTGTSVNSAIQNKSAIINDTVATNQNSGGAETRPNNLTVNMFVKINNCN